jgi:N-glycosylase/DNA lyase
LGNGQCFNWTKSTKKANEWTGVVESNVVVLRQSSEAVDFKCLNGENSEELKEHLEGYFHLNTPLAPLYKEWSAGDPRMKQVAACADLKGMRVIQQNPTECLFSFICSSNNNIPRIIQMLDKLRKNYGKLLCSEGQEKFYAFPTIQRLSEVKEEELRALGFGYRAKFIVKTAQLLQEQGDGAQYLLELRGRDRQEVKEELLKLCGVGPKVADCVALFSLDQHAIVPVDTHVWQIAIRDYDASLKKAKSLTPAVYEQVGDHFRGRFGVHAGWAHSLLFAAELPQFTKFLPKEVQEDMEQFRKQEKQAKLEAKQEAKEAKEAKLRGDGGMVVTPKGQRVRGKQVKTEKKEKKEKRDKKEKRVKKEKKEHGEKGGGAKGAKGAKRKVKLEVDVDGGAAAGAGAAVTPEGGSYRIPKKRKAK